MAPSPFVTLPTLLPLGALIPMLHPTNIRLKSLSMPQRIIAVALGSIAVTATILGIMGTLPIISAGVLAAHCIVLLLATAEMKYSPLKIWNKLDNASKWLTIAITVLTVALAIFVIIDPFIPIEAAASFVPACICCLFVITKDAENNVSIEELEKEIQDEYSGIFRFIGEDAAETFKLKANALEHAANNLSNRDPKKAMLLIHACTAYNSQGEALIGSNKEKAAAFEMARQRSKDVLVALQGIDTALRERLHEVEVSAYFLQIKIEANIIGVTTKMTTKELRCAALNVNRIIAMALHSRLEVKDVLEIKNEVHNTFEILLGKLEKLPAEETLRTVTLEHKSSIYECKANIFKELAKAFQAAANATGDDAQRATSKTEAKYASNIASKAFQAAADATSDETNQTHLREYAESALREAATLRPEDAEEEVKEPK